MNVCDCGCGYQIGSEDFIKFHVPDYDDYIRSDDPDEYAVKTHIHSSQCFCAEVW